MRAWSATIGVMLAVVTWASPATALARGAIRSARATSRSKLPTTLGRGRRTTPPSRPTTQSTLTARIGSEAQAARPIRKTGSRQPTRSACRAAPRLARVPAGRSPRQRERRSQGSPTNATSDISSMALTTGPQLCAPTEPSCRGNLGICLDTVENGETCSVGGPPGTGGEPARITGLSAHELSLGVVCQAPSGDECVTGATEHKVWAAMYGATVTLRSDAADVERALGRAVGTGRSRRVSQRHRKRRRCCPGCRRRRCEHRPVGRRAADRDLHSAVQFHVRPAVPAIDRHADAHPADDAAIRRQAHAHARRNRRRRQSVERSLGGNHGGQQRASGARRPVGEPNADGQPDVYGHLERSARTDRPDHRRDLPSVSCKRIGRVQRSGCGARGRAGDHDRSRPWKLEHRCMAEQRSGQCEPCQRCTHKRRRAVLEIGRFGLGPRRGSNHAEGPCHGDAARTRAGRTCGRACQWKGPRRLHRPAERKDRCLWRQDRLVEAWPPDGDVQARPSNSGARSDPREREARPRDRRDQYAPPASP
jgi:hypothetical protein